MDTSDIMSYVVVDTETTGLSPVKDDIIELSALKVTNGAVTGQWSRLIRPRRMIPEFITKINHITNEMVRGCPRIEDIIGDFLLFIGNDPVMGHNVSYDMRMINAALKRAGRNELPNEIIDTLVMARDRFDSDTSCSLANLCTHFGITNENAHRSLSDCKATKAVYDMLRHMPADKSAHGVTKVRKDQSGA